MSGTGAVKTTRSLAYALPRDRRDADSRLIACNGFELHDEPLRSPVSFLDYDGVVTVAGAFESYRDSFPPEMVCIARADLDLREREFFTAAQQNKTAIFLVPHLPTRIGHGSVEPDCDLFRRVAQRLDVYWDCLDNPDPAIDSLIPEFKDFISRYGTGYVILSHDKDNEEWIKPICASSQEVFGLVAGGKIFFLPCTVAQTHDQIVQIALAAVEAAIAYRKRISTDLPEWVAEFSFGREASLQTEVGDHYKRLIELNEEIGQYGKFKGALCYQSDPLVGVVSRVLDRFLGLTLCIDDKCIEDAMMKGDDGEIIAVFEIKGVKGNFTRKNVNQIDSHRERLGLSTDTPGVLIMNTIMSAASLQEKDQPPHPDIIKKAVSDNVLLIRTLDLLRYADCVEKGVLARDTFKKDILAEAGWLKVENDTAQVVKG